MLTICLLFIPVFEFHKTTFAEKKQHHADLPGGHPISREIAAILLGPYQTA
jgi:hypothetical protein